MKEPFESKECWSLGEIIDLLEILLRDKCRVEIGVIMRNCCRTDTAWLVSWKKDKELVGGT